MTTVFEDANALSVALAGGYAGNTWYPLSSVGVFPAPFSNTGIPCYASDSFYYPACRIDVNVTRYKNKYTAFFLIALADPATTYSIIIDEDDNGDETYSVTLADYAGTANITNEEKILHALKAEYEASAFNGCTFVIEDAPGANYKWLKVVAPADSVKVSKSVASGTGIMYGYCDVDSCSIIFLSKARDSTYESYWGQLVADATYGSSISFIADLRGVEKVFPVFTGSPTKESVFPSGMTPLVLINFVFFTKN
jgi:hypothetical protein